MTDLKDVCVTQVALGKAHVVALTAEGRVYTFGINHRGQCGREFAFPAGKEGGHLSYILIFSQYLEGQIERWLFVKVRDVKFQEIMIRLKKVVSFLVFFLDTLKRLKILKLNIGNYHVTTCDSI